MLAVLVSEAQQTTAPAAAPATAPSSLVVIPSRLVAPATVHVAAKLAPGETPWWDFGDPSAAYNNAATPFYAHVYENPGTYRIQLLVFDGLGAMRLATQEITVVRDNRRMIHVSANGSDASDGTLESPVRTLSRACQIAKNDSVILLRRGERFDENRQIAIAQSNLRIGSYGDDKKRPLIRFRDADWKTVFLLTEKASEIVVEDINFDLRSKNFAIEMNSSQTTIRNCDVVVGGGLLVAKNAPYLLVDNCGHSKETDRGFLYTGGINIPNINVIIRRCWSAGSKYEHCLRVHNTRGLLVQDCVMDNSKSAQGKQALNLRDGSEFHVLNSKIIGPCVFGPLADKAGGLYDEPGAERDRKLSLRLKGLQVSNCSFDGYAIIEAGLIDFVFQDSWIKANIGGACFQLQGAYGPRQPASGIFRRVGAFYDGGKAVSGPMKDVKLEQVIGNVRDIEK
jgi:hypothetical protein